MVRSRRLRMDSSPHHQDHLDPTTQSFFFQRDRNKLNKIWIKNRVMREERGVGPNVYIAPWQTSRLFPVFKLTLINFTSTISLFLSYRFLRLFFSSCIWLVITLTYWKAASIKPPLQPWLPSGFEQSTRFCSDRSGREPKWIFMWPSSAPVEEKAQHDPHWPKFRRT